MNIGFATFGTLGKSNDICYYETLGLEKTASSAEIKTAYREMAKKYHPDVNTTGDSHQPNADKFREIAEAYAVLSLPESKINYDSLKKRSETFVYTKERSQMMQNRAKERDESGSYYKNEKAGSYAESRQKELALERKKFNVGHLGYYNGGLPREGAHNFRGKAMNAPGEKHNSRMHNTTEYNDLSGFRVGKAQAQEVKQWYHNDKPEFQRTKGYYGLIRDPEMRYQKERTFTLYLMLGYFGFMYLYLKSNVEEKRRIRIERHSENLDDLKTHHFINRGGVLVQKQYVGLQKYFKNQTEAMEWEYKVHPELKQ